MYRVEVRAELSDGTIWLTFFDRHKHTAEWRVDKKLRPGTRVMVSGKFGIRTFQGRQRWELAHPEVDDEDSEHTGPKPLYPVKGKLTSLKVEKAVRAVLAVMPPVPDPVPADGPPRPEAGERGDRAALVPLARGLGAARSGAQAAQVHRGLRRPDRAGAAAPPPEPGVRRAARGPVRAACSTRSRSGCPSR